MLAAAVPAAGVQQRWAVLVAVLRLLRYVASEEADDWHAVGDREQQLVVEVTGDVTVAQALQLAAAFPLLQNLPFAARDKRFWRYLLAHNFVKQK